MNNKSNFYGPVSHSADSDHPQDLNAAAMLMAGSLLTACAGQPQGTRLRISMATRAPQTACNASPSLQFDDTGRVLCRGADCRLRPPARTVIDGGGKTVWPGLIDAHAHLLNLGYSRQQLELNGTGSLDEVQQRLARWHAEHPGDGWIIGRGWNQMHWPVQAFPVAADIDRVVGGRPVALERIDGHALWVNSPALALAGIDASTKAPAGGEIIRDSSGRATGILVDNAEQLVRAQIPGRGPEEIASAYRLAMEEANRDGADGGSRGGQQCG